MFHESPDCQVVRRLTWNPFYDDLLEEIRVFLEALGEGDDTGKGE